MLEEKNKKKYNLKIGLLFKKNTNHRDHGAGIAITFHKQ